MQLIDPFIPNQLRLNELWVQLMVDLYIKWEHQTHFPFEIYSLAAGLSCLVKLLSLGKTCLNTFHR